MLRPLLATLLVAAALAAPASAQVDVTFRFLPDLTTTDYGTVVRAFVPGSFNDWGPNASGRIAVGAPSQATYNAALNEHRYTVPLQPGQTYAYKVHVHENDSGSAYTWYTDPLGTETTGPNNDSVIRVADPMVFQIAREQNGTGQVLAVSAGVFGTAAVESVTFTVNEDTFTDGIDDLGDGIFRLTLPRPVAPGAFVRVEATVAGGQTAAAEVGTIPPTVPDAPVPDGLADGITYDPDDPTRAWLVLRAPDKQYVYALGDFNGWTVSDDALMTRDASAPLGTRWWIELTGLTPGTEVAFQYWVDGQIRVADPYTTKVYYPGESGYPSGAVEHAVGVLTPGAAPFPWTDAGFEAPPLGELVVYELLVRDFVREHSFTALTDTLDYLERLGVNAIELMPVSEFDGNESWGYNPAFHLALDKYYGTPDDFKAFVDAAHARGIAVLLDVVYNHATGQSPLIRLDNQGVFGAPNASNPWANVSARHPFNVFNDLNHESELTQLWLDQANRFWMDEYHVDGYRFDLSKGFTQTCGGGPCTDSNFSTYNPARIGILTRMADALWEAHPEARIILEHFAEPREERELAAHGTDRGLPGMALWSNVTDPYYESAMGYLGSRSDLRRSLPGADGYPFWGRMAYMESHDEQWQMYKTRSFGNQTDGYNTRLLPTALDRKKLATVFFLTLPGPRMLWQFGELGYGGGPGECLRPNNDCPTGTPDRVGNKPIRWDYWSDVAPFANGTGLRLSQADDEERGRRQKLYGVTAALLDLRERYEIFRSSETSFGGDVSGSDGSRAVWLSLHGAPDGQPKHAVVMGNFGVTEVIHEAYFMEEGTWYEYFTDTEVFVPVIPDPSPPITLRPGEFRIYTDVDIPSPAGELGAVASEGESGDPVPEGLGLVYPNPAAGAATVGLTVYTERDVRVELLDVLGRRVRLLADGLFAPGTYEVRVETAGLPAGTYVVRWGGQSRVLTVTR